MKKKILAIFLLITAATAGVFGLSACTTENTPEGETGNNKHGEDEHTYAEYIVTPTCTEKGYTLHTCECGESYIDTYVNAKGHTEVIDEAVEPTCTEKGKTEGKHCTVCNDVLVAQTEIEATGHTWDDNFCTVCEHDAGGSKELEWKLDEEKNEYSVVAIGSCTDTEVVICSVYNGLPVTRIENNAFITNKKMTGITIPDSVTFIGESAFENCVALESVRMSENITEFGDYTFRGCVKLNNFSIPYGVTFIGEQAFDECMALSDIVIPDSVTDIGKYAFWDCTGLTSISIPDSVTSIGECAFMGCVGLTSIVIPDSVTTIEYGVFDGCYNLKNVTIPKSITRIVAYAFYECSKMENITFNGTKEQWLAINKDDFWDVLTNEYTITCTDDTLDKDGNEIEE